MTVLEGALKKLKDQKENFGYMDRFTVDENYEVMKLIEEKISNDTVASHSEQEIYKGCIALMQELTDEFAKWYEWVHGEDAIAELDDEEMFCLRMTPFHIVQRLFLWCTTHSGSTSTRQKCGELGIDDWAEDIAFKFEREEQY